MSIESRFRAYLPKERIKGLWETDAGLAFIQRQRVESGLWESPGPEPTGLYHVVIHLEACQLSATHNGRVHYSGYHPARTIQFSRPEEEVRCTGCGSINFLLVSFTPDFLTAHFDSLFVNPDVVELRDVQSSADVGLAHLAQAYDALSSRGLSVTQLYFDTIRQAMVDRIVHRHATRPIGGSGCELLVPARTRRVIDYVETNLATDLRLVELSAVAGISRSHFARAFRNTVGMAPHAFVLQRRLARAVELLAQRKLSIREVAERCGFADQAHLTRSFKSRFGRPPSLHMPHGAARTHRMDHPVAIDDRSEGDRALKVKHPS
jgi:AraC family transcriptional regulator